MQYTTEHSIVQHLGGVHACLKEQESSKCGHNDYTNNESAINVHAFVGGEISGLPLRSLMLLLRPDIGKIVRAATHHLGEQHDAYHETKAQKCAARMEVLVPHTRRYASRGLRFG